MEPALMLQKVYEETVNDTETNWAKYGLKIESVSKENKKLWTNKSTPLVTLFYETIQLSGFEVEKIVDFEVSSKLISLIQNLGNFKSEEVIKRANENWQRDIRSAGRYSPDDYERLRTEFPNINYKFEEILVLRATGMALHMIHSLSHVVTRKCIYEGLIGGANQFKLSSDRISNMGLEIYAKYFCDNNKQLCLVSSLWYKGKLLLLIFSFSLLFSHLARPSLNSILSEQARARKMRIDLLYRLRVMIFFWQAVIFTDRRSNLLIIAKYICEDYKQYLEDRVKKIVAEKAKAIQTKLEKELGREEFEKDSYLKILLNMAQGFGRKETSSLAYRQNALKLLEATLEKLRAKSQSTALIAELKPVVLSVPTSKKPRAEKEIIQRRENLLAELVDLLPKTASLDLSLWRNGELDNLKSALILLRMMGQDFVPLLLAKPNFETLIKASKSEFMSAVTENQFDEISKILEENGDSAPDTPEVREDLSLPSDLEVVVISGDKLIGRKAEIIAALKALGPKSVNFVDVNQLSKASDAIKSDPANKLVVLTFVPHGFSYKIQRNKKLPRIWVDTINPKNFAREVAQKYQKYYKTV